jgi:hypothetical protein
MRIAPLRLIMVRPPTGIAAPQIPSSLTIPLTIGSESSHDNGILPRLVQGIARGKQLARIYYF